MDFIDLFSGLGGFHKALSELGHTCVFACEKDKSLRDLYKINFGVKCSGDIKEIDEMDIPNHDILCAGFPCQPFSKAGNQKGLGDIGRGDLIYDIFRILKYHRPRYFILENVPNLKKHDRENTWKLICKNFLEIGYDVKEEILSPHQFGIPQIRKRIFIVGSLGLNTLNNFTFPIPELNPQMDIRNILTLNSPTSKKLSKKQIECINLWQEIINVIPADEPLPGFPIWGMEFQANYPLLGKAPNKLPSNELSMYKGSFGASLKGYKKSEQIKLLPGYANCKENQFPKWKRNYIQRIRIFLNKHKIAFKPLFKRLEAFPPSWQKLEWNCGNADRTISNYLLQFRASGIRVKKTDFSPALVLTSTQIPIIGWEQRYISLEEAARLQGLDDISLPAISASAYRALGNAVSVQIIRRIAEILIVDNIAQPIINEELLRRELLIQTA